MSYDLFIKQFDRLKLLEGIYSNHPKDRGGETYIGIARNNWPNEPIWKIIDKYKKFPRFPYNLKNDKELPTLVRSFYYRNFWQTVKGDEIANMSEEVAGEMFEQSVVLGVGRGSMNLQRVINAGNRNEKLYKNIRVDGAIGVVTLWGVKDFIKHRGARN